MEKNKKSKRNALIKIFVVDLKPLDKFAGYPVAE